MSITHAQGEWRVSDWVNADNGTLAVFGGGEQASEIVAVCWQTGVDTNLTAEQRIEQMKVNARLIAKAPHMLSLLVKIADDIERITHGQTVRIAELDEWVRFVRELHTHVHAL